jgi:hypothetical protein
MNIFSCIMDEAEKLINVSKTQAEAFLLDAGEFYPFGNYIDKEDEVKPLLIYLENDMPKSQEVIEVLEDSFKLELINEYKIAAIATDVLITVKGEKLDALQIRLFEDGKEVTEIYLKYTVNKDKVEFGN